MARHVDGRLGNSSCDSSSSSSSSSSSDCSALSSGFSAESLEWEEWRRDCPFYVHAVAGSCAGVAEHVSLYPLDTLKTRLQALGGSALRTTGLAEEAVSVRGSKATSPSLAGTRLLPSLSFSKRVGSESPPLVEGFASRVLRSLSASSRVPLDRQHQQTLQTGVSASSRGGGLLEGAKQVYREAGFKGFFRGAGAVAAGCVPAHACYFSAYEFVKARLTARREIWTSSSSSSASSPSCSFSPASSGTACPPSVGLSSAELLLCGATATLTHDLVLTPVDVLKQRMQLGCFRSTAECLRSTLRREGFRAFFRSLPASMLLNVPQGASVVFANETLRAWTGASGNNLKEGSPNSLPLIFLCAGISGGFAGFVSNPLDVIKTRLQTQDCAVRSGLLRGLAVHRTPCPLGPCAPKYKTVLGTAQTIFREEGMRGFMKGVSSRVALGVPATAICWG